MRLWEINLRNGLIGGGGKGKDVRVFVEVKGGFDEENKVGRGELMGKGGIEIILRIGGVKVDGKVGLIVGKNEKGEGLRR